MTWNGSPKVVRCTLTSIQKWRLCVFWLETFSFYKDLFHLYYLDDFYLLKELSAQTRRLPSSKSNMKRWGFPTYFWC